MFSCKACSAHRAHIETLQAQIADLRRLAALSTPSPLLLQVADEADAILEGRTELPPAPTEASDQSQQESVDLEAARLLSGTY